VDKEPAAAIPAPLARRGKRPDRPDFVAGERKRWRPSEVQWRTIGYVAIGVAMIAAVVVMGVWRLGSDEPTGDGTTEAVMRLQGSSSGGSEPFELTSGTHRLSFSVEISGAGTGADYIFSIVPTGAPADEEIAYAVEQGVIDPSASASAKSGDVLFDRAAGSYYLKVFSNNCTWTAEVSAKE
jgi:hypothetical protein